MATHGRRNNGKSLRTKAVLNTSVVNSTQSLIQSGFLPIRGQNQFAMPISYKNVGFT